MNNTQLAIKLFSPDENGISRWVKKTELTGEFISLYPKNGNHWYRNKGLSKYIFEKSQDENGVIMWRFNGFTDNKVNRYIQPKIKEVLAKQKCVHTGFDSMKSNPIEIDHKNGRYNGVEVIDVSKQKIDDFQPLSRQSNLLKRTSCRKCKETNKRYDAKSLGYTTSFVSGDENYNSKTGCVGCYWYDCLEFKKNICSK